MQYLEFRSFFAPAPATSTVVRPARTHRTAYGLALAATLLASAAPAFAAAGDAEVRVAHGDLNLATESGIASLDHRIDRALDNLCAEQRVLPLYDQLEAAKCRRQATAAIRPERDRLVTEAKEKQGMAAR